MFVRKKTLEKSQNLWIGMYVETLAKLHNVRAERNVLLEETDAMQEEIDGLQTALAVANETIDALSALASDPQCETDESEFVSSRFVNG